jgi:hypothetical protein
MFKESKKKVKTHRILKNQVVITNQSGASVLIIILKDAN